MPGAPEGALGRSQVHVAVEYCLLRLLSRAETIRVLQKQGVVAFITATGAQLLPQLHLGLPPAFVSLLSSAGAAVCCGMPQALTVRDQDSRRLEVLCIIANRQPPHS